MKRAYLHSLDECDPERGMAMKSKFVVLGLAIVLAACGREDPPVEAKPAGTPTPAIASAAPMLATLPASTAQHAAAQGSPRQLLDAWLEAWNTHDMQLASDLLAEDVEYFDIGFSGILRGRAAALEQGVSVFQRGLPDLHWALRGEPIVGADAIAWEWTLTGTNTGTWGGIPATQQPIQLKGVSLMRVRGGKISSVSTFYDTGTLNRQLGL